MERPTLSELIERVQTDAESRLGKKAMRWTIVPVLSRVIAGVSHTLHGRIQFVLRQIFSSTAEGIYLERRASEFGIFRKPAVKATGTVTFTGTGEVPAGTMLQTEDGTVYVTLENSKAFKAPIEATVAGKSGNAKAGLELSFVSPVQGVFSQCVADEISGGVDAETDEVLRERLLFRQQQPPMAGTKSDYVSWALAVPGVTRAWCYPMELGQGTVTVRFVTDDLTENGIPTEEKIKEVKVYISEEMPVTTILTVVAPIPKPLDLTVDVLPDTPEIREKVKLAIQTVIYRDAIPSGGILLTELDRAIAGISEIKSFRIETPTDDVKCSVGELFVPGEITFS